jgi:hypothetical protein
MLWHGQAPVFCPLAGNLIRTGQAASWHSLKIPAQALMAADVETGDLGRIGERGGKWA